MKDTETRLREQMTGVPDYGRLPQDIRRCFEDVLGYGEVADETARRFRDKAVGRFARVLLHKYRVVEVHAHLMRKAGGK